MASPNISFDSIPSSIRKPGVYSEINTSLAVRSLPAVTWPTVIVAQKTSAGTVAQDVLTTVFSDADAQLYFGAGSQAHRMVKACLDANPYIDLDVLPLDDGTGTPAAGFLLFTGTATASGTVKAYVDNNVGEFAVAVGDTAAVIAVGLYSALYENSAGISATLGSTGACVTLTAKNDGTYGNHTPVSVKVDGVVGIANTTTLFTGGATDVDVGTATAGHLSYIASAGHKQIIWGQNDATNVAKHKTFIDFVSNSLEQRPAIGVYGYTDLVGASAAAKTLAGTTLNHGRSIVAYLPSATTVGLEASPCYIAAAFGGVLASEEDPARPFNNMALPGIPAPNATDRITRTVIEDLLRNGVTPLHVMSGERVGIVRAISTYVTNSAGIADPSLLDITTIRTLDYVRQATVTRLSLRFPRNKLSSRTAASVKAEVMDVLYQLESLEILEQVKENADGVIVERDTVDVNRLNVKIPADVVNGLHVIAERIDLLL